MPSLRLWLSLKSREENAIEEVCIRSSNCIYNDLCLQVVCREWSGKCFGAISFMTNNKSAKMLKHLTYYLMYMKAENKHNKRQKKKKMQVRSLWLGNEEDRTKQSFRASSSQVWATTPPYRQLPAPVRPCKWLLTTGQKLLVLHLAIIAIFHCNNNEKSSVNVEFSSAIINYTVLPLGRSQEKYGTLTANEEINKNKTKTKEKENLNQE